MSASPSPHGSTADPLRLRELLQKACHLASNHAVGTVVVGMAAPEGDLLFPEMVAYVGSALRIDDAILRLTRERAVFFLADSNRERAEEVMERVVLGFREQFATVDGPDVAVGYFEVKPDAVGLTVKDVLPALFTGASPVH
jgi:GGDEF domain-containing protein